MIMIVVPGVALNPHTGVENLSQVLDKIGLILIMTVNPGLVVKIYFNNGR